ncbi:MAG: hypothetical protein MI922_16360 [Bacteroidales bacterium]|nr:hypothetical protein [Bacteroidales bacterium]
MAETTLSDSEIQELMGKYLSELNKLEFQVKTIKKAIGELNTLRGKTPATSKSEVVTTANKKAVTISEIQQSTPSSIEVENSESRVGYKLSDWDKLVIASIKTSNQPLLTYEIIDYVRANTASYGLSDDIKLVKNKVTRSLQKLVNRRGDLAKAEYEGKGFIYALPDWINNRGKLVKEFRNKSKK